MTQSVESSDRIICMDGQEFSETRELPPITNPSLVLILGPSGAGKSEVIKRLTRLDERIVSNTIYTDRPPRENDFGRVSVTSDEFTSMIERGEFLTWDPAHGNRYGERKEDVLQALSEGKIPIQDYPEVNVSRVRKQLENVHAIYILPPSLGSLHERIGRDGRDSDGGRFQRGMEELLRLKKQHFNNENIDDVVISRDLDKAARDVLEKIYAKVC